MHRLLTLLVTICLCGPIWAQKNHNFETARQLDIFNALYRDLDLFYVDTLDAEKVIGNAIEYMLDQLDPYTEYYKEDNTTELKQLTTGKYAGIGSPILYRKGPDRCVFDSPYSDMPAAKAGVRTGDIIIAIDGRPVPPCGNTPKNEYTTSITQQLRGDPGTTFKLRVERPGVGEVEMQLTRQTIKRASVAHYQMLSDTIGYILLESYTEDTARDLRQAIVALRQGGMRRMVLDLRSNPGGLMEQAVKVVNFFIPRGKEVLRTRGKIDELNQSLSTTDDPIDTEMPIAVLVDYGTASAAEITSGALQDYDRAVIVGRRTYGKGLVQAPRSLPYSTMMKVTTSKYFIPSGRCIQAYDFKNRGADGQPRHLPDSLCKTYYTTAGRPVRDGGGITPDVTVKLDSVPSLIPYLEVSDVLFDWCVRYHNSHKAIAAPEVFQLSDADFADFKAAVAKSDFTYDVQSHRILEVLGEMIRAEGYGDEAKAEYDALAAKLTRDAAADIERLRPLVTEVIERHLVSAFHNEQGLIRYNLRKDPDLVEALRILSDDGAYYDKLSGPNSGTK